VAVCVGAASDAGATSAGASAAGAAAAEEKAEELASPAKEQTLAARRQALKATKGCETPTPQKRKAAAAAEEVEEEAQTTTTTTPSRKSPRSAKKAVTSPR
jgi:hypothetical protein